MPSVGSTGPAASLPSRVSGPGLQSGFIQVRNRKLTLPLACSSSGRVTLSAPAIRAGTLARGRFTCQKRQASAQLSLRPIDARRLNGLKSTIAGVSFGAGAGGRFSIMLQSRPSAPPYWSDGGMECSLLGSDTPYLVAPNFTVVPPTIIDVRPWVAWYTAATGWRWIGTTGVNTSSWYRWTDTPAGVQQWFTPTGALKPVDVGADPRAPGTRDLRAGRVRDRVLVPPPPVSLAVHAVAIGPHGYRHVLHLSVIAVTGGGLCLAYHPHHGVHLEVRTKHGRGSSV